MNIFQLSLLLAILLKCVIASENVVAQDVIDALGEDGFKNIKSEWWRWQHRHDLFDHVVMKSVEFITGFINQVEYFKKPTLAALFIKRSDEVDDVLKKIEYSDDDLIYLTNYRPELAESHENFFKAIDKIQKPENQEMAVYWGVINLVHAKKHDSVIPLINALEKRQFNGRKLNEIAIRRAFYSGVWKGIKDIVEKFHEHPAITSKEYAYGLIQLWQFKDLEFFQFLLDQADQGDLEKVKQDDFYKNKRVPEFCKAIDDAFSNAEPAGSRHRRFFEKVERARLIIETLDEVSGAGEWGGDIGDIIASYLVGEPEETEDGQGQ